MAPKRYSDQELLKQLRTLSVRLGRTPTVKDIEKAQNMACFATFRARFGSLKKAQQKAGLAPTHSGGGRQRAISDEAVFAEIRACAKRLGRTPSLKKYQADKDTKISADTIRLHFGTWNKAVISAGLVPKTKHKGAKRKYTDEFLIAQIQECAKRLGKTPTTQAFAKDAHNKVRVLTLIHRFGSWNNALQRAGLEPVRVRPDSHLAAKKVA